MEDHLPCLIFVVEMETVCNLGIHQIADISSDQVNNIEELENLSSKPSTLNANTDTIYKLTKLL